MLIFKKDGDKVVINWDVTDPNDAMMSETMAAEMLGFDGITLAQNIRAARERGGQDADSENALYHALYPKQQAVQLRD